MGSRIAGKVCVVTGAGSGIGRASALRLAEEGGRVLCADVNEASANETVAMIRDDGGDDCVFFDSGGGRATQDFGGGENCGIDGGAAGGGSFYFWLGKSEGCDERGLTD